MIKPYLLQPIAPHEHMAVSIRRLSQETEPNIRRPYSGDLPKGTPNIGNPKFQTHYIHVCTYVHTYIHILYVCTYVHVYSNPEISRTPILPTVLSMLLSIIPMIFSIIPKP